MKYCNPYLIVWLLLSVLFGINNCLAGNPTIRQYWQQAKSSQQPAVLESSSKDGSVETRSYRVVSQRWPQQGSTLVSNQPLWEHVLKVAIPVGYKPGPALLYISGGNNYSPAGAQYPDPLPIAALARQLGVVVAELYFVPNQYLSLDDHKPGREDDLVAYSWRKAIDQPQTDHFSSLHLPMTQAVEAAIDTLQQQVPGCNAFVLSGSSKRGWITWLTGVNDPRVKAIVPVAADFWNLRANFTHVYNSYDKQWPIALRDYNKYHITDEMLAGSPGMMQLAAFEDVLHYPKGMARLTKYLISAAGDDFAVPDSAWTYLPLLTGVTQVRYLPNSSHYVKNDIIVTALQQFMQRWLAGKPMPQDTVESDPQTGQVVVATKEVVTSARAWVASNTNSRDFRFRSSIMYQPHPITGHCQAGTCRFSYQPEAGQKGWQSYFIELEGKDFTWTSPPLIWPRRYTDGSAVPFAMPTLHLGE